MSIWKEYSLSYLKNNKSSSVSILVASFIASLLLSLTCGVFYNIWRDEIRLIKLEEGDWQGKIIGNLSKEDITSLQFHPNVDKVILEEEGKELEKTILIYFHKPRSIYQDLPQLAKQLELREGEDSYTLRYHDKLLAQYFIFSSEKGKSPPLIIFVYLFTLIFASISLILIIHNAYGVSMNTRLHQLGILQSIGATPRQLRYVLTMEAFVLSLLPILLGVASGVGLCYGFMQFIAKITDSVREYNLEFEYHPYILVTALVISFATVWLSARIPARKISKISPLEAIRYGKEPRIKKMKRFFLLSHLFGIEGELARKSLYLRRRAFRTSSLSLTFSFLVFSAFLNLETISSISTRYTFFERYKNGWDLMLTIPDKEINRQELLKEIRAIPQVKSCISYEKALAYTTLSKDLLQEELLTSSGNKILMKAGFGTVKNGYRINVPFIILDDDSFQAYCNETGISTAGFMDDKKPYSVLINTIWDSNHSNRKDKKLIPFVKEESLTTLELQVNTDNNPQELFNVNIAAFNDKLPKIREEAPDYSLIQIIPESSYELIAPHLASKEAFYNIMAKSETEITRLQKELKELLGSNYEYTLESRLEKEQNNITFRNAYKIVIGALASLFICIGLANVFSNTLGHIHQRKRELARYMSIGLTPKGVKKVLRLEAFLIAVKPIFISLLINIPLIIMGLNASLINVSEFLEHMPLLPITVYALIIISAVGLAYYLGGRKVCKTNLLDVLKDDTMI